MCVCLLVSMDGWMQAAIDIVCHCNTLYISFHCTTSAFQLLPGRTKCAIVIGSIN